MPTCHFDTCAPGNGTETFPFSESDYEVIMREARTAAMVGTFRVPGAATDRDSCPTLLVDHGDTVTLRRLAGQALGQALRPIFPAAR